MEWNDTSGVDRPKDGRASGHAPRLPRSHLAASAAGLRSLGSTLASALDRVGARPERTGPLPHGAAEEVLAAARDALGSRGVPRDGVGCDEALVRVARALLLHGLDLTHPNAAAHLQPPPLSVAVAADAIASATNASLDTFDSGPSGIALERWSIEALARLAGLDARADGVMTPGGSMSNLLALLLARDAAAARRGTDARREGVAALGRPVVFCSEVAHFSVDRACAALGLGERAVRAIPVDDHRRMRLGALARALGALEPDELPIAIVATAGTTDFGSVDPLHAIAELAARHRVWMHVDAAYGFGALFSDSLAPRLDGLARAHSVTVDLHKLGWQPAAASVLLVSDASAFAALDREVAYLNPRDDAEVGYDGLLGRSLQTTRRPDAAKVAATLLAYGTRGLGRMVDACHELARHAELRVTREPLLELVAPAELTTVVFRYRGAPGWWGGLAGGEALEEARDALNGAIRRRLLESGAAVLGRTCASLDGNAGRPRVCLKLTLLNPCTRPDEIDALIDLVLEAGLACGAAGGAS